MSEQEWRAAGIQMSRGWQHFMIHRSVHVVATRVKRHATDLSATSFYSGDRSEPTRFPGRSIRSLNARPRTSIRSTCKTIPTLSEQSLQVRAHDKVLESTEAPLLEYLLSQSYRMMDAPTLLLSSLRLWDLGVVFETVPCIGSEKPLFYATFSK